MNKHIRILAAIAALAFGCLSSTKADNYYGQAQPVNYDQRVGGWIMESEKEYYSVRIGITAPLLFIDTQHDPSRHAQVGMALGFAYGTQLTEDFPLYLEPGIFYVSKGFTINSNLSATDYQQKMSIKMHTFEVPVVFKYRAETMVDDLTVDPFFGGFLSLGIGGKTKYFSDAISPTRHIENTFRSTGFKSFDIGLRLGCGLTYQQFYAEACYNWGLSNIARSNMEDFAYDDFDDHIHSGCFEINVGIMF